MCSRSKQNAIHTWQNLHWGKYPRVFPDVESSLLWASSDLQVHFASPLSSQGVYLTSAVYFKRF